LSTEKTDFLISPAYQVPPMSAVRFSRLTRMKTSELVPSEAGSARSSGAWSTVKPGRKSGSSESAGWMNMLRANRLCHACSVTTRTLRRSSRSAPA
jgi:hypothetical protein